MGFNCFVHVFMSISISPSSGFFAWWNIIFIHENLLSWMKGQYKYIVKTTYLFLTEIICLHYITVETIPKSVYTDKSFSWSLTLAWTSAFKFSSWRPLTTGPTGLEYQQSVNGVVCVCVHGCVCVLLCRAWLLH